MANFKARLTAWKQEIYFHKLLIAISVILFILAMILNYFSGIYVDRVSSVSVDDLILDHIPVINLSLIFIYGMLLIVIILFLYPLIFRVNMLHIVISQYSLLIAVRSVFISLTHLKAPAEAVLSRIPEFLEYIIFRNDLFFSGHVSICFLGYLLFRHEKIRFLFLFAAIIITITVLLMHVHYSIDVFAAFFITYGCYKIGNRLFKKIH